MRGIGELFRLHWQRHQHWQPAWDCQHQSARWKALPDQFAAAMRWFFANIESEQRSVAATVSEAGDPRLGPLTLLLRYRAGLSVCLQHPFARWTTTTSECDRRGCAAAAGVTPVGHAPGPPPGAAPARMTRPDRTRSPACRSGRYRWWPGARPCLDAGRGAHLPSWAPSADQPPTLLLTASLSQPTRTLTSFR